MELPPPGTPEEFLPSEKKPTLLATFGIKTYTAKVLLAGILGLIFICSVASFVIMPPSDFPVGKTITIEKGSSLGEVSLVLKKEHMIRSRVGFEFCALSISGEKGIQAGDYVFKEPTSLCMVALRLARGVTGLPAVRLTIPEGVTNKDIAEIAHKGLAHFNTESFLTTTKDKEGFLFPETYFLLPTATETDVVAVMEAEFQKNVAPLQGDIKNSGHTLREVVIMASIVEKEARTETDQKIISGILWKRIAMKMALQVDAPFLYALGKTSAELTQSDLKTDSPYNTYTRRGLPVGPIGNPGLSAIRATIYPTTSPYLYYLSDKDGVMHYAKTFEEHKANKAKYLR